MLIRLMRKLSLLLACLCLLLAGAASLFWPGAADAAERVIHKEKSLYRNIVVWEGKKLRCLTFTVKRSRRNQTCIDLKEPNRVALAYVRMMFAALLLNPEPKRMLMIGLGGGTLSTVLGKVYPGLQQDLVEIDPAVVKVAKDYFGFVPTATTKVAALDGRVFTRRAQSKAARYDLIILDAFTGDYIPEHLMTTEFLAQVKNLLTADGVVVANTFLGSALYDHESVTYEQVFGEILNLTLPGSGNRVILASRKPLPDSRTIKQNAKALAVRLEPYAVNLKKFPRRISREVDWDRTKKALTDQYSPANLLRGRDN